MFYESISRGMGDRTGGSMRAIAPYINPAPLPLIHQLTKLYRHFYPTPKSPIPNDPNDADKLTLVPGKAFKKYLINNITKLGLLEDFCDYYEFGVYNATSFTSAFEAIDHLGLNSSRLFGYDSFQGLPPGIEYVDNGVWFPGQFTCSLSVCLENIRKSGIPENRYEIIRGWYSETLTGTTPPSSASVVMIDCDASTSASLALAFVAPALAQKALIIFDDWRLNDLDLYNLGESGAFSEFYRQHSEFEFRHVPAYSRKAKAFLLTRRA